MENLLPNGVNPLECGTKLWIRSIGTKFIDTLQADKKKNLYQRKEILLIQPGRWPTFGTLLSKNNNRKLAIIIAGSGPTI